MPLFQLTVKRKEGALDPVVEARYGSDLEYSIPKSIAGIEAAIGRLQTDIIRDAATRQSGQDQTDAPGDEVSPNKPVPTPSGATAREMGTLLFRYLFDGRIETLYRKAVEETERDNASLQVTLVFSDDDTTNPLQGAPWLNLTPWETLWDDRDKEFLATAGSTSFSRAVGGALITTPRHPPLRVLIMAAKPQVFEGRKPADLKSTLEVEKITAVLREQGCVPKVVAGESFDDLQQALFENNPQNHFDVFHFIGHGDFDPDRGEGYLLFREPDGAGGMPVYATELRDLLTDPWAPRLVVLNSCNGARGRGGDLFSSTAARLSLGRIPAVVAMQFPITDRAAIVFSRSFYKWLGQGATVQDATRRARWSLRGLGPEWITPVLYLRSPEGRLVPRPQSSAAVDEVDHD